MGAVAVAGVMGTAACKAAVLSMGGGAGVLAAASCNVDCFLAPSSCWVLGRRDVVVASVRGIGVYACKSVEVVEVA